jgi:hypothetical protein
MKIQIRYIEPLFYLNKGNGDLQKYGQKMDIESLSQLNLRYNLTFGKKAREKLAPLIKILHQK